MRSGRVLPAFAAGAVALGMLLATAALAGSDPDPDAGDALLGTSGPRYSSDGEAVNLSNNGYARSIAGCGPDTLHTAGGGVKLTGPPAAGRRPSSTSQYDWYDVDSIPEDGWVASGYGASAGTLTTFAICMSGPLPTYVDTDVADSAQSVRSAKQACPPGSGRVISGGGQIATSESFISRSQPFDGSDGDSRPDDGWAIRVYDTVGGIGGMRVRAVCYEEPVDYASARERARAGRGATATARCPDGTHVVGGGAGISGPGAEVHLAGTHPFDDGDANGVPDDGWRSSAFNDSSQRQRLTAHAVCIE